MLEKFEEGVVEIMNILLILLRYPNYIRDELS